VALRDEGPCWRRQCREDHPHGGGDSGQCARQPDDGLTAAWPRNQGVGRQRLSGSDSCNQGCNTPGTGHDAQARQPQLSLERTRICQDRNKSKVPTKGEHPFLTIKRVFGFACVRYRGLFKNANRLFVTCALANLHHKRHHLLRMSPA
jgi:hypothetical protein